LGLVERPELGYLDTLKVTSDTYPNQTENYRNSDKKYWNEKWRK
jgi:hypothetical protein